MPSLSSTPTSVIVIIVAIVLTTTTTIIIKASLMVHYAEYNEPFPKAMAPLLVVLSTYVITHVTNIFTLSTFHQ
jgi:hypothetical protein